MKCIALALSAAAICAVSVTATVAEPIPIGQTIQFGMDNMDRIGTLNNLLNRKLGGEDMVTGGTLFHRARDQYLFCGYYTSLQDLETRPKGFAINTDVRMAHAQVSAPLSSDGLESKGCFPGEKERLRELTRHFQDVLDGNSIR